MIGDEPLVDDAGADVGDLAADEAVEGATEESAPAAAIDGSGAAAAAAALGAGAGDAKSAPTGE